MGTFMIYLAVYAYSTFCLYRIADRLGMESPWVAFVPVLNLLLCAMIDKPLWYSLLFIVPFVNLIWVLIVWMRVAEQLGWPSYLGVVMILPLVNLIFLFLMAFLDTGPHRTDQAVTPDA
jgi:hypothetical protein